MSEMVEGTETNGTTEAPEQAEQRVPLRELLKEREARQALSKELATYRTELQKRDAEKLTKEEQLSARLREFETRASQAERMEKYLSERRDASLQKLPKDIRERLAPKLADVPADLALEIIEAAGLAPKKVEPTPEVERGSPARPDRPGAPKTFREYEALPVEERRKWRDIAHSLPD